ncbi:MAG: 8-oxoguanine deaminase [Anaerolineaceae bacterium]|nr:8-oxoguanine deaminase [Anaerolineaceae bacterium]
MPTTLLQNATLLVTMDDARRRIAGGGLYIEDNVIRQVGPTAELPLAADRVLDAAGMVVLPGLVNCHHHLYQSLTRALPAAQDAELFDWLQTLYPVWAGLTGEAVYVSALTALSEMVLSGCTTAADHLYLYPNDSRIDDEIRAARQVGVRFHPNRGSMSLGKSQGGLPPDSVTEDEDAILADSQRAYEAFHDPAPYSMCRIVIAPCSPFSVTPDLMRASAAFARERGLHLHTHVAETLDEEEFCLRQFGVRPAELMRELGWVGPDVWWTHCVHLNEAEVRLMAETGTGVTHCPSSNMRLGSGIAPIRAMIDAGVNVGLGVDGSASNDSSHMLAEARQAMLLQRVKLGASALSAEEALWLATRGGAAVLGRDDVGALAPGMAADFIGVRLDRLAFAGCQADPLAALVFCEPPQVDLSVINGCVVVEDAQLRTVDLPATIAHHNRLAEELLERARS